MRTEKQASKGQQILAALNRAYPAGLTSIELMEITSRAQARIHELKQAGWDIQTIQDGEDATATYRLTSLQKGEEEQVQAGCVLRLGTRTGWASRTHADALKEGTIPDHVLRKAEASALAAYRGVVEDWQASQVRKPIEKSAFDLFSDL